MIHRVLIGLVIATLLLMSCESQQEEVQEPEPTLSVDIIPQSKSIVPGGIITYKMDILNIGVGQLDIAVEHQLIQLETGKALQTKGEILQLKDRMVLDRGLPVPETAEGGMYEVRSTVSYSNKTDTDSFQFEVFVEEEEEEQKQQEVPEKTEEQKIQMIIELLNQELTQEGLGDPDVTITIDQWGFHPREVNLTTGQIVMWVNTDVTSHTAVGAGFDSGGIRRNEFYKHRFTQAGNYPYHDTYRSSFSGVIHVEKAP